MVQKKGHHAIHSSEKEKPCSTINQLFFPDKIPGCQLKETDKTSSRATARIIIEKYQSNSSTLKKKHKETARPTRFLNLQFFRSFEPTN